MKKAWLTFLKSRITIIQFIWNLRTNIVNLWWNKSKCVWEEVLKGACGNFLGWWGWCYAYSCQTSSNETCQLVYFNTSKLYFTFLKWKKNEWRKVSFSTRWVLCLIIFSCCLFLLRDCQLCEVRDQVCLWFLELCTCMQNAQVYWPWSE